MPKKKIIDSLKKRYIYKLSTSFLIIPLQITTAGLIPRMLGPEMFGNYTFLLYSFTQVFSFVGSGNSYLSTRLAENNKDKSLINFYWKFIILISIVIIIPLIVLSFSETTQILFPGQNITWIWIVFFIALMTLVIGILTAMTDACALTVNASIIRIISKFLSTICLISFYYFFSWHSISAVFAYNYMSIFVVSIGLIWILKKNSISIYSSNISRDQIVLHIKSFYKYSAPLFTFAIILVLINYLSRLLLQAFGGSIEQGYFSLAFTLSSFVIIFSNSLSPLLLREFSILRSNKDINNMGKLFKRVIYFLFSFSAYFSIFLFLQASKTTYFLGGKNFSEASLPLSIMMFFPISYTVNNIIYSMFYSTNRTKLHRNLGIIFNSIGLVITFWLIAPEKYYGLNLGAIGYAISMVSGSFLSYLIMLKYCLSYLQIAWMKFIFHHIVILSLLFTIGIPIVYLGDIITNNIIISFILSGFFYSLGVIFFILLIPDFFGTSIEEIKNLLNQVLNKNLKNEN